MQHDDFLMECKTGAIVGGCTPAMSLAGDVRDPRCGRDPSRSCDRAARRRWSGSEGALAAGQLLHDPELWQISDSHFEVRVWWRVCEG